TAGQDRGDGRRAKDPGARQRRARAVSLALPAVMRGRSAWRSGPEVRAHILWRWVIGFMVASWVMRAWSRGCAECGAADRATAHSPGRRVLRFAGTGLRRRSEAGSGSGRSPSAEETPLAPRSLRPPFSIPPPPFSVRGVSGSLRWEALPGREQLFPG